jgi:hypothetical protein
LYRIRFPFFQRATSPVALRPSVPDVSYIPAGHRYAALASQGICPPLP